MKLHELSDNPGAAKSKKRVGRGPGSGKGKMGGRGIKGQTSRSGVAIKGYEGGQMPIHRRLPKRGFNPLNPKSYAVINLDTLEKAYERGALSGDGVVDEGVLVSSGVVRRPLDGVKLLAKGEISRAVTLKLAAASAAAKAAVEKAGGSVEVVDITAERRAADRATREAAKAEG
jgi:large subunit ribosomal protein L15